MEMIDIDEIITNIEWSLEGQIKKANAVIVRNVEVKQINFSKKNLRSIIFNLVSNAIKFSPDKQPVVRLVPKWMAIILFSQ